MENALNIYKFNKLFLVTSCLIRWQLTSNWLTWKFGQQKALHLCALFNCTQWESSALQGHLLHISRVHVRQVEKSCVFNFKHSVCMNTFWARTSGGLAPCCLEQIVHFYQTLLALENCRNGLQMSLLGNNYLFWTNDAFPLISSNDTKRAQF